eukprot:scaffold49326_cov29-Tisochrysis_lutea.AAC.2
MARPSMRTERERPLGRDESMRARAALTDESEASGSHRASGSWTGFTQKSPRPRIREMDPET